MHKSTELTARSPSRKQKLWNLSQLLSQNLIITPQKAINQRFFPEATARLIKTSHSTNRIQNFSKTMTKKHVKINFQHYRMKNSLKNKQQKLLIQPNFLFQRKISDPLLGNTHKQFLQFNQSHRFSFIQSNGFSKKYESQQLSSKTLSVHHKSHEKELLIDQQSREFDNILVRGLRPIKNNKSLLNKINPSESCSYPSIQWPNKKKSFLRKGASLQKQIVVNLLKNKMVKEQEFDIEKQYTMKDIMGMIKLYKGIPKQQIKNLNPETVFCKKRLLEPTHSLQLKKISRKEISSTCPIQVVQQFQKSIEGWEVQPEIDIQFLKNTSQPQQNKVDQNILHFLQLNAKPATQQK